MHNCEFPAVTVADPVTECQVLRSVLAVLSVMIVTELEPASHAMIINVADYSSVRRTLVG